MALEQPRRGFNPDNKSVPEILTYIFSGITKVYNYYQTIPVPLRFALEASIATKLFSEARRETNPLRKALDIIGITILSARNINRVVEKLDPVSPNYEPL